MSAAARPLNRQEATFYFLFAALLVLGLAVAGLVVWAVTPPSRYVHLGAVSDFPPGDAPYIFNSKSDWLYVVNTGDELLALNPRLAIGNWNCLVIWINTNERFEDPCSGAKLSLTGTWLGFGGDVYWDGDPRKNMDGRGLERYRLLELGGQLWMDLSAPTPGPRPKP